MKRWDVTILLNLDAQAIAMRWLRYLSLGVPPYKLHPILNDSFTRLLRLAQNRSPNDFED